MNSFILERSNQMPIHTDMRRVFNALDGCQLEYNWLITNLEHYTNAIRSAANTSLPDNLTIYEESTSPSDKLDKDPIWISGEELTRIIYGNSIQFVWGVFSGFRKNIDINIEELIIEPYADGNPNFWVSEPKIQHPLADIEVVCWDSTLTLFLTEDDGLGNKFKEYFKDLIDLKTYNKRFM
ncbi:hypothetical protein [Paenibacillus sp. 1781tsa1]|uniref:hypothetical protein n=1 Tax=Paenibacillus sp. 1781tsa1 TaxID=2953810 RepID=UPI0020A0F3F1|nr:hypothetical protein [Paenibacillus sp. 1781tsa1]MCP1182902.1 hypothetical protein [Paenibacillus sp. 1781tsa1]